MAAPLVRTVSSTAFATDTQVVLVKPVGTVSGDLILAAVVVQSTSPGITAPSGWVLVDSVVFGATSTLAVYRKAAGGAEPADYTWTYGGSFYTNGGILRIDGHDPTTPVNAETATATSGSTTSTSPAVTTTVADCLLLRFFATGNWRVITDPAGYTQRYQEGASDHECITRTQAAAGSTGTDDFTLNANSSEGHVVVAVGPTPPAASSLAEEGMLFDVVHRW